MAKLSLWASLFLEWGCPYGSLINLIFIISFWIAATFLVCILTPRFNGIKKDDRPMQGKYKLDVFNCSITGRWFISEVESLLFFFYLGFSSCSVSLNKTICIKTFYFALRKDFFFFLFSACPKLEGWGRQQLQNTKYTIIFYAFLSTSKICINNLIRINSSGNNAVNLTWLCGVISAQSLYLQQCTASPHWVEKYWGCALPLQREKQIKLMIKLCWGLRLFVSVIRVSNSDRTFFLWVYRRIFYL